LSETEIIFLFEREKEWAMGEFVKVASVSEVGEGELAGFSVGGERIAVANVSGTPHAFDDTCTHQGCSLAEGELEGTVVTCPCHGSQFDVVSGEVLRGPAREPVRSYAARVESEAIQVEL
jgi:nitrite reductase/ring-hydroxylating ferredoxin subunit